MKLNYRELAGWLAPLLPPVESTVADRTSSEFRSAQRGLVPWCNHVVQAAESACFYSSQFDKTTLTVLQVMNLTRAYL